MREREVIRLVAERLRSEGLSDLQVRYGAQRGADIEGRLPRSRRRLFVEAKGVRSKSSVRQPMGEALLQILGHYDEDVVCAIAVPFTTEYEELLRFILPGIRKLGLHLLLVRRDEIWYNGPQTDGFFPEKVESLVGRLDG